MAGQMHFNKATSLKNLVLWQRPWLKKSTTTELQKFTLSLFIHFTSKMFHSVWSLFWTSRSHLAWVSGVSGEKRKESPLGRPDTQAIHIQNLCLSPSHYETACIAGRISRQVRRFLGSGATWRLEAHQFPGRTFFRGWRVAGGGWRIEGDGWQAAGDGWRVKSTFTNCQANKKIKIKSGNH